MLFYSTSYPVTILRALSLFFEVLMWKDKVWTAGSWCYYYYCEGTLKSQAMMAETRSSTHPIILHLKNEIRSSRYIIDDLKVLVFHGHTDSRRL